MNEFNVNENNSEDFNVNASTSEKPEVTVQNLDEKIEYSPINTSKPSAKGVKIFAVLMAFVVAVSGSCIAGYFIGKNNSFINNFSDTTLNLEPKPTDVSEYSASEIFKLVDKSIVGITIYNSLGDIATASGVVYTEDGYIITNDHIYSEIPGAKFKVRFYDGKEYAAEFVAGDSRSDLAVIKIDASGFTPAVFGDSAQIIPGERVVAVGRPNQVKDNCITEGIVSLKERRVTVSSSYSMKMIQTSAAINPGSSGGALVNMYGQVIGITSSKMSGIIDGSTGTTENKVIVYEGTGFAIPSATTKKIVESLISFGCVNDRARLGISYQAISELDKEIGKYNTTGILVVAINEDSDLFGKIDEGDIITEVNGVAITSDNVILDIIENSKPDQKLEFTVYTEENKTKKVSAKLLPDTGSSSYVNSPIG